MKRPGFWRLVGAYGIDLLILLVLNYVYYMWEIRTSISASPWIWSALVNLGIFIILNAGYFTILERKGEGSFGKKVFHLKVQTKPSSFRVFGAYGMECVGFFVVIWAIILGATFVWNDMEKMFLWFLSGWLLGPILICLYYSILEHIYGCSFGKKLMGLTVVQATPAK